MKNKNKGFNPTETKKEISAKLSSFEDRLLKSKNDFETVLILQEMRGILQTEVSNWFVKVSEFSEAAAKIAKAVVNAADKIEDALGIDKGEDHETLIDRAAKFIGEFEELISTINDQILQFHENAVTIETVYLREGKIKERQILPLK